MPPAAWTSSAFVAAPPDAVYAWMTDFRADDHARPAFRRGAGAKEGEAPATRTVVSREGNVVVLEDRWGRRAFRTTATLDPARREVRVAGGFGYSSVWRAAPEGPGTRLTAETSIAPPFPLSLLAPLFARGMRKQMEADFRGHAADLEAALVAGAPKGA